jgi:toxin ParE1/3/4
VKRVVFSPEAAGDLEAIADYIAADNPRRALSFIKEIRRRCQLLGRFPLSARRFPELGPNAHILPYRTHVILYRNTPSEVSIERVLHGARDILALIGDSDQFDAETC